jgi:hypothetical protein
MALCMGDVIATSGAAPSRLDLVREPACPNVRQEFVPQLGLERPKTPVQLHGAGCLKHGQGVVDVC